ncbi:MAG TPA: RNA methyltransferase [Rhodocyclaceae bacterium]
MKLIASRDNPTFKQLRDLASDGREQRRQGMTVIDGPHLVETYRQRVGLPELLVVSESGCQQHEVEALLAGHAGASVICLRDSLFREISGTESPVGILALIRIPEPEAEPDAAPIHSDCVLLDRVQDAGNVGSILRSAAAAGIPAVMLSEGCAGAWTPKVLRAAQGAHFSLRIVERVGLADFIRAYPGETVATVVDQGEALHLATIPQPRAWLFGNEGQGASPELTRACSRRVTIPLAGNTESLNVAAAAAICLFSGLFVRNE